MTATETTALDLNGIVALGMAFCDAKVLLTATELRLFTVLAEHGPSTEEQLLDLLGLHPRGSREFLNSLVRLGLLHREDGVFRNAAAADTYLVVGRPDYVGKFLDRSNRVLYPAWTGFTESLRTGESQIAGHGDDNMFTHLYRDEQQMRDFVAMMDALNSAVGPVLAEVYDWSDHTRLVDIGGCRGNIAATLVKAHPHMTATVFDLPEVEPVFDEHIAALGMTDKVSFVGGDFFADPAPAADVAIIGHVLEDWSEERRRILVRKAFDALDSGGTLLVYDPMLDDELSPLNNYMTSLTMLVVTHGGSEYAVDACEGWLTEAGFVDVSAELLATNDILVTGRKP
ncbi:methyltransferase [Pseudonocardia sp. 73-21]|uniref:methyltransferase n=1 Tax=Pseudonocardia sp. 73-21 TaxID=1895809 RepID=UPI00095F4521|nr:methyltransferase [Pseudonocardia sp. 73-21]OJY38849.1 MAG: hypothetical protein BGP03_28515 [Pseudonocardia sp. 73-21]